MTTITREHLEDEVLKSIQKKAESIMPKDAKVILFGSRARRDAKADSDWDILVLLNKDKIDEQDHDNYTYPLLHYYKRDYPFCSSNPSSNTLSGESSD